MLSLVTLFGGYVELFNADCEAAASEGGLNQSELKDVGNPRDWSRGL